MIFTQLQSVFFVLDFCLISKNQSAAGNLIQNLKKLKALILIFFIINLKRKRILKFSFHALGYLHCSVIRVRDQFVIYC